MGGNNSKKEKKDTSEINKDWNVVTRGDNYNLMRDKNGREGQEFNYVLDNRYDPAH